MREEFLDFRESDRFTVFDEERTNGRAHRCRICGLFD
jgi:hypothetical protein